MAESKIVRADPSLIYTSMLQGVKQPTNKSSQQQATDLGGVDAEVAQQCVNQEHKPECIDWQA